MSEEIGWNEVVHAEGVLMLAANLQDTLDPAITCYLYQGFSDIHFLIYII